MVEGSEFKQDDSVIFVIGSLLKHEAPPETAASAAVTETSAATAATAATATDVKQVVTVPTTEGVKRRKKVLAAAAPATAARSETLTINPTAVQDAKGTAEGTD